MIGKNIYVYIKKSKEIYFKCIKFLVSEIKD